MSVLIRPSTPEDATSIVELMRRAGLNPSSDSQLLHWKYWQERADWPAPRSFVFVKDGVLAAHTGMVPGACHWGSRRATVIHMIDWAAPAVAGAGVALLKYVRQHADALLSIGGSDDTLRVLPIVGFRRYGTATSYVRVIHPMRYRGLAGPTNWKVLPKWLRNSVWALGAPGFALDNWSAQRVASDELDLVKTVLPGPSAASAVMERSTASLAYLLDCPGAKMALYRVEKAAILRGYFVLATVPGQVRLVDCWIESESLDDWRALIQCAVVAASAIPDAAELVTIAGDPQLSSCLPALGFHARSRKPILILAAKGVELPSSCPRIQMVESDDAYRHLGYPEYWA